jgi:hypothetical protein
VRCLDLVGSFVLFLYTTVLWEVLSMKRFCATALLAIAAMLAVGDWTRAAVTAVGYYRLGEADAGAVAGNPIGATTADSSGLGNTMNLVGGMTYSSDVAASAAAATGSNFSMSNPAVGYGYVAPPLTTAVDNFGMEGWFKLSNPTAATTDVLAWNGNAGGGDAANGWGLICYQGTIQGYYANVAVFSSGFAPTADEWFYVAMVRDNGVTSMYIDSAAPVANTTTATPITPASISALCTAGGADGMNGLADEVRVFTFEPGAFNASADLLIAVPEPSTFALLAMSAFGLIAYAWRRQR